MRKRIGIRANDVDGRLWRALQRAQAQAHRRIAAARIGGSKDAAARCCRRAAWLAGLNGMPVHVAGWNEAAREVSHA